VNGLQDNQQINWEKEMKPVLTIK